MSIAIALIIFSLVFGTVFFFIYRWWKNYGKKMYDMMNNMGIMNQSIKNMPKMTDVTKQIETLRKIINKKP
jgi:hypothetical protein